MKDLFVMVGLLSLGPGIWIFFGLTYLFANEKISWARQHPIGALWLSLLFVSILVAIMFLVVSYFAS